MSKETGLRQLLDNGGVDVLTGAMACSCKCPMFRKGYINKEYDCERCGHLVSDHRGPHRECMVGHEPKRKTKSKKTEDTKP